MMIHTLSTTLGGCSAGYLRESDLVEAIEKNGMTIGDLVRNTVLNRRPVMRDGKRVAWVTEIYVRDLTPEDTSEYWRA